MTAHQQLESYAPLLHRGADNIEKLGPREIPPPGSEFVDLPDRFVLHRGDVLRGGRVAFEVLGPADAGDDRTLLLLTGLSASAHVASHAQDPSPGWWEGMVGSGRPIDTDEWRVICVNSLGSCFGSSGAASIDPSTGREYGSDFPVVSIEDIADAAAHVLRNLGHRSIASVIGTSMGGMSALALIDRHPGLARSHISISASQRSTSFATAVRSIQRQAIRTDPRWRDGHYDADSYPVDGMRIARKLGLVTYRSAREWDRRFGREQGDPLTPSSGTAFAIETYLDAAAERFVHQFDPNCYLSLSRAIDLYDRPARSTSTSRLQRALVVGAETDLLFPVDQQEEIATDLLSDGVDVNYAQLATNHGHDAFLIDTSLFGTPINDFLQDLPQPTHAARNP